MDIQDIAIAEITDQFLAHIEVVRQIDVERAGDFLLVAATLMLIKSRTLLPRPEEEEDPNEEIDPRTDLVRQLLEYKQFKDSAHQLEHAQAEHALRFRSGLRPPKPDAPDAGKLLADVGVDDLLLAFERMMRETLADVDHQVFGEVLPLRQVETVVTANLTGAGGEVFFRDLFWERKDRFYIVSVFLCLLEMLRRQRIELDAGEDVRDLRVRLCTPADASPGIPEVPESSSATEVAGASPRRTPMASPGAFGVTVTADGVSDVPRPWSPPPPSAPPLPGDGDEEPKSRLP